MSHFGTAASWARRETAARVLPLLPSTVRSRLVPDRYAWGYGDMQTLARPGDGRVRLLIAPANYASQGYFWARAAETLPNVSATNLRFLREGLIPTTPSDVDMRGIVGQHSHIWARKQRRIIHSGFTHVLIEANRSILGSLYEGDLAQEVAGYLAAGIKVGFVSHGSDVRLPSRHRALEPRSPFNSDLDGLTDSFEGKAQQNLKLLDAMGLPEFVSTPDLKEFRPDAKWLPVLANQSDWTRLPPPPFTGKITVMHVPSRQPALKGAHAIRPALKHLEAEGLIDYLEVSGVPYGEMPDYMSRAQVVVNQVDMGLYAAAAVEGMYAGRLVVADVWDSVRRFIKSVTGWDLPIVQASGDNVYEVVKKIALNPSQFAGVAREGQRYALEVHSQKHVANVLRPFLLGSSQ